MTEFTNVEWQNVSWFFNRELIPAISKRLREEDSGWYVTVHLSESKSITNAFKTEAEADQFIKSIINPSVSQFTDDEIEWLRQVVTRKAIFGNTIDSEIAVKLMEKIKATRV